jgi:hypothetical protein
MARFVDERVEYDIPSNETAQSIGWSDGLDGLEEPGRNYRGDVIRDRGFRCGGGMSWGTFGHGNYGGGVFFDGRL